jgi:hypothetical protein
MRNHHFTIGHAIYTHLAADAGSEDLLGATASDAEKLFERRAVDPGIGQGAKGASNRIQVTAPGRFVNSLNCCDWNRHSCD